MVMFVLLPFAPLSWIRAGVYLIPLAVTAQWVVFGGCVCGNPDREAVMDTTRLYRVFLPSISRKTSIHLTSFVHVLVTTVMAYRMSGARCCLLYTSPSPRDS